MKSFIYRAFFLWVKNLTRNLIYENNIYFIISCNHLFWCKLSKEKGRMEVGERKRVREMGKGRER